MGFEKIVFYVFALIAIGSATMVITVRNPVKSALYLVLTFFSVAAVWLILEAEFLAIVLVLVYVGAVMVLFLFVVMMLDINLARLKEGFINYLPIGIGVAITLAVMLFTVVGGDHFDLYNVPAPQAKGADYSNTIELGMVLYTQYVFPFEVAAVILLVAIIAAIVLTLRRRPNTRYQHPEKQVSVQKKDRLRVISMQGEERK